MTDDNLSKRERQKERRKTKVEAQQAGKRQARMRQIAVLALVAVVVLAGIGVVVASQVNDRRQAAERRDNVAGQLEELGCTEVEQEEDFGGGDHISGQALATNGPEAIYTRRPTSAGPHLGSVAPSGVFDDTIDERLVVHNLEHGYAAFWWDPDADAATIDAVKQFVNDNLDEYPKLIAAPYNVDLPNDQAVTTVAWSWRQECTQFDPDVALTFIEDHYGLAGDAPEKSLQPHNAGGQGVVDPAESDGPVLFPPLDAGTQALPSETAPAGSVDENPTAVPTG